MKNSDLINSSPLFKDIFKHRFNPHPSEQTRDFESRSLALSIENVPLPDHLFLELLTSCGITALFSVATFSQKVDDVVNNPDNPLHDPLWQSLWERDFPMVPKPTDISFRVQYEKTFLNMFRDLSELPSIINWGTFFNFNEIDERYNKIDEHTSHKELSQFWLDYRAQVNLYRGLLVCAISHEDENRIKSLLHLIDDLESDFVYDKSYGAALFFTIKNGFDSAIPLLIEAGAKVLPEYLHLAIRASNFTITNLLIERGIDINSQDATGNTPLHYAKNINIIKLLLEKGADPRAVNNNGQTPLDMVNRRIQEQRDTDEYAPMIFHRQPLTLRQRHFWSQREVVPRPNGFLGEQIMVKQALEDALNVSNAPSQVTVRQAVHLEPTRFSRIFSCCFGRHDVEDDPLNPANRAGYLSLS